MDGHRVVSRGDWSDLIDRREKVAVNNPPKHPRRPMVISLTVALTTLACLPIVDASRVIRGSNAWLDQEIYPGERLSLPAPINFTSFPRKHLDPLNYLRVCLPRIHAASFLPTDREEYTLRRLIRVNANIN